MLLKLLVNMGKGKIFVFLYYVTPVLKHHVFGLFQARLTREHRWGSALLSRNHSLEEEFERAKAAVEVPWFIHVSESGIKTIKLQQDTYEVGPT